MTTSAGAVTHLAWRAQARVDLDAISANVRALAGFAPGADLMAVVKADGYGHGLVQAARAARAGGAGWLGVAVLEEALALRHAGVDGPVLCWLAAPGEDLAAAVRLDVDLSADSTWQLAEIAAAAGRAGRSARVHLKIDTGMGRAGAAFADWPELVDAAGREQAGGAVEIVGVWSHLACADEPNHPSVARQIAAFRDAIAAAERAGLRPHLRHLSNSAGTVAVPAARFDLVRPGISVYGYSPAPELGDSAHFGLRPAMTLAARLAHVKRVPAGHGVSYGHTYVTQRQTNLGLVPIGYADGIPRTASGRGPVQIGGTRHHVAGRVCMDQFVVDLGGQDAAPGDEVLVFGPGDGGEPTVAEWADLLGTISYEIVTRIGGRIPRVYTGVSA
ncbi:MAG: alanine racemase [Sporichthyaceae bacterium]